jgi:hypothetical protein
MGKIGVTVDNFLTEITINGEPLKLYGDVNNWQNVKVLDADLKAGDVVSITGKNHGAVTSTNPAGIIATIQYLNLLGEVEKISTGRKWICDGTAPKLQGKNKGKTVWSRVNKGPITWISNKAHWIWNTHATDSATCTITLPGGKKSKRSRMGKIDLSVDNILKSVTVNGKAVKLSGSLDNWAVVKSIKAIIRPGDEIKIAGESIGAVTAHNPASMIATIKYLDNDGKVKILNTDNTWTCDGAVPFLQGENSGDTIWKRAINEPLEKIDAKAVWIWNDKKTNSATCSVIIPIPEIHGKKGIIVKRGKFGRCSRFNKIKAK